VVESPSFQKIIGKSRKGPGKVQVMNQQGKTLSKKPTGNGEKNKQEAIGWEIERGKKDWPDYRKNLMKSRSVVKDNKKPKEKNRRSEDGPCPGLTRKGGLGAFAIGTIGNECMQG